MTTKKGEVKKNLCKCGGLKAEKSRRCWNCFSKKSGGAKITKMIRSNEKYHTDELYRQRHIMHALKSYYKSKGVIICQ